ncbi:MFS transporter [Saccharopolyspora hattusasensis]|uniref:MFS transporter n=1 Tax=Saccharopolyspora hattusasensis TaxID=1128679 RepID=UPI003D9967C4
MPNQRSAETREIRRVALAGVVGNALEWYDFFLYGTAAALIFNKLFFSTLSPLSGTLAAFATYAVGFGARPLGGMLFGHIGDRVGRKYTLIVTLVVMGVSTALIGCLPTYGSIGAAAPILLVVLRLVQGVAVGGEWGGAASLVAEHAPPTKRGFWTGLSQSGVSSGFVLSTLAMALVTLMPEQAYISWGWRLPFLFSAVLVVVGLLIRVGVAESPAFLELSGSAPKARLPLVEAVRKHPRELLVAIGARLAETGGAYLIEVFILSYATQVLHLSRSMMLWGLCVAVSIELVTTVAFGALSDRIGRRPVYLAGAALMAAFAFPLFWLVDSGTPALVWFALIFGMAVCHAAMSGAQACFFAELFDSRVRYSGASLGHEIGGLLAGGFAPLVATALLAATQSAWPVALLLAGLSLLTLVSVAVGPETKDRSLMPGITSDETTALAPDPGR